MVPLRGQNYTLREIFTILELDDKPVFRVKTELGWGTVQSDHFEWQTLLQKAPKLVRTRWQFMRVVDWTAVFQSQDQKQTAEFFDAVIWPGMPEPWITPKLFPRAVPG